MTYSFKTIALAAACFSASPVQATILGNTVGSMMESDRRCLAGETIPSEKAVTFAHGPSVDWMRSYWQRAKSSEIIDLSFIFTKKGNWINGEQSLSKKQLASVSDPLAKLQGGEIASEPIAFFRAASQKSAAGVWIVNNPDGSIAGSYRTVLTRKNGIWLGTQMTVSTGPAPLPLTQYCLEPGDIEINLAELAKKKAEKEARQAARRAAAGQ